MREEREASRGRIFELRTAMLSDEAFKIQMRKMKAKD
jgi:hypothetical protein